jgi:pimeloyl-ACP methyl ester carboxylesterase
MLKTPKAAKWLCRHLCGVNGPGRRFSTARKMRRTLGWWLLHAWGPKNVPNASSAVDPETKARLLDALADCWLHSWESIYGSLINCMMEYRPWSDLERLRAAGMPILFLHGDQDSLAPIKGARRAAACGGWKLQEYAGGTHALCLTNAEELGQQIAHFLSDEQKVSRDNSE